jgi:alkylated DNA nucleotide flippase Atl1
VLRRGRASSGNVDPGHDVAVAVGLDRLKRQVTGVLGELPGADLEVVVVVPGDGPAGPGEPGDGVGDRAIVGSDRGWECRSLDLGAPPGVLLDEHTDQRVIGREDHLDLGGLRVRLLVGHPEADRYIGRTRHRLVAVHGDVRRRRRRRGNERGGGQDGQGGGAGQRAEGHRAPPYPGTVGPADLLSRTNS